MAEFLDGNNMPLGGGLYRTPENPVRFTPSVFSMAERKSMFGDIWYGTDVETGRVIAFTPKSLLELKLQPIFRSEAKSVLNPKYVRSHGGDGNLGTSSSFPYDILRRIEKSNPHSEKIKQFMLKKEA